MAESLNPYEPPRDDRAERLSRDRIEIRGEVTEPDVAELINDPLFSRAMRFGVLAIVVPILIAPVVLPTLGMIAWQQTLGWFAFASLVATCCLIAGVTGSRRWRARQIVNAYPQIVGPVEGELNGDGFLFRNAADSMMHVLSWGCFRGVTVTRQGIRLDWGVNRFVAIPAHCVDGFDAIQDREIIAGFRKASTAEASYRVAINWDETPAGALRFSIPMRMDRLNETKTRAVYYVVAAMAAAGCAAAGALLSAGMIGFGAIAGLIVLAFLANVFTMIGRLRTKLPPLQWSQWGWLDSDGCHVSLLDTRRDFQWQDVRQVKISDGEVQFVFPGHSSFAIASQHFINDDWSKVATWRETLPEKLNVVVRR